MFFMPWIHLHIWIQHTPLCWILIRYQLEKIENPILDANLRQGGGYDEYSRIIVPLKKYIENGSSLNINMIQALWTLKMTTWSKFRTLIKKYFFWYMVVVNSLDSQVETKLDLILAHGLLSCLETLYSLHGYMSESYFKRKKRKRKNRWIQSQKLLQAMHISSYPNTNIS